MHDPLVVAFTIPRPWPQRTTFSATGSRGDGIRWQIRHHHVCIPMCADDPPHSSGAFPWWKPGSYRRFWRLAGRDFYWPPLVTVWHREPGGHDALSLCQTRYQDKHGDWHLTRSWRWHVRHWKLQVHPLQAMRRHLLTRCAWCGGHSRKGDPVNLSHSWDGPRGRWWQGEPGLYHHECSSVQHAHSLCLCETPVLGSMTYGQCGRCGRFRSYGQVPDEADRLLASLPAGSRIPADLRPQVEAAWEARRSRRQAA